MRYSTQPKDINRNGFLSFTRKSGGKYNDKLTENATKLLKSFALLFQKLHLKQKRFAQKEAQATGDLIGNKKADKRTSFGISRKDAVSLV